MKYRDYYKVLGVEKNATEKEIQKAYKSLAKKYHPDVSKDKGSDAKFKEINEAYEVLGDKDKRKKYDTLGADWDKYQGFDSNHYYQDMGNMGGKQFYGSDFSDFFEIFFGNNHVDINNIFGGGGSSGFGSSGSGKRTSGGRTHTSSHQHSHQSHKDENILDIEVSLNEAFNGGKKQIQVNDGFQNKKIEVSIPKGVENGTKIRIPGKNSSDIYLKVKIKDHHYFKRDKNDLTCEIPITDYEAVLGSEVKIPTISGTSINFKIPPGTQSGKTFRLKNLGMSILKSELRGDMYVKIKIMIPESITEKEKELFYQLKELRSGKDRIRENIMV